MITKERNIEIISSFHVSEFHLEMIILPYIIKEMENDRKVIIVTENKLEESVKYLISKLNINENEKEKVLKLDWNNNTLNKNDKFIMNKNETFIIIGSKRYIDQKNQELNLNNIKILNCYNLEEVQEEVLEIRKNSNRILSIKGEE